MMNRCPQKLFFLVFSFFISTSVFAQLTLNHLQVEYRQNPLGVDAEKPQLSWQLVSKQRGVMQSAYRILVADEPILLQKNTGNIWDSKKVSSDASIQISYAGKKLEPNKTYYWKVMIWDEKGTASAWSAPASWQMGLLAGADWKGAEWIGYENMPDSLRIFPFAHGEGDKKLGKREDVLPLLRKEFAVKKGVKKATLFVSGLGQFELSLNGKKVGDHFLDPGWTLYDKHALYVTFDITGQIKPGQNAVGVMLGNGFYYIPGERYRKITGAFGYPKMICRLALEFTDGSTEDIVSDTSWKATPGPVTFSSIYGGEDYDATKEQTGWDTPGFNDKKWRAAVTVKGPEKLQAQSAFPLKIFDRFEAKKITEPKPGVWLYDLGQNASGIPRITVRGKKGAKVVLRPAELITASGLADQSAVGEPVFFNYTLKGAGMESWQPQFMYYGFRYVQVEGAVPEGKPNPKGLPVITDLQGLHTRNAAPTIGKFTCSNELFNKTFHLIDWAIRSNTASVLTDCPHREKLGWLEEAHLVGASIRYNYDIASLCRKVVRDMMNAQTADGLIPDIAPEYVQFDGGFRDSPEWGSNSIIMSWYLYEWYGDKQVLAEAYPMMQRYAAYLGKKSKNGLLTHGLGDWYDIGPKPPGESQLTPKGVTATAIYYYDLSILTKVARLLNKPADVKQYEELAKGVKKVFNDTYFHADTKQYATGSQTANAMAVYMNLVEPADKAAVVDNIVKDLKERNNSLTAGDIGYRYLLRVLDEAGRSDVIYAMNNRNDVPGYGFQLAKGATALTESWQGARDASNNHFMLGHLMEWFYSGLGGIKSAGNTVAFREINIKPELVGDVTSAKASYQSPYGLIATDWKKTGNRFYLEVTIPTNTSATVFLPAKSASSVTESGKALKGQKGFEILTAKNGSVPVKVGSGVYRFEVNGVQ